MCDDPNATHHRRLGFSLASAGATIGPGDSSVATCRSKLVFLQFSKCEAALRWRAHGRTQPQAQRVVGATAPPPSSENLGQPLGEPGAPGKSHLRRPQN